MNWALTLARPGNGVRRWLRQLLRSGTIATTTTYSHHQMQLAPNCRDFVGRLQASAPTLFSEIGETVEKWLAPLLVKLESGQVEKEPKIFNDPIWGSIVLQPAETLLLDTPLLQRLRGVRQLGMAYCVYPGAGYDRLQHVCGVVEAAQQILTALNNSAERQRGVNPVPQLGGEQIEAIRLAALLHDIGHGPFSHATEDLIGRRFQQEINATRNVVFEEYPDVPKISVGEIISVLMVLSSCMLRVFTHARFPLSERENMPMVLVGAIIGSAKYLPAPYLAGVISGPIDGDKLDYMARDSHHAGLNIGLETTRLLSQLQVVTITADNAPSREIRARAGGETEQRYFDLGISRAGIGAYEQMVVGRAILFDRLYYHHKVRAAEAMVRRLISLSEADNGEPYGLRQLLPVFSDDTFLCVLGGLVQHGDYASASDATRELAQAILNRELFFRAFAFATRYLTGLESLSDQEKTDTRALVGRDILKLADNVELTNSLESKIAERARKIGTNLGGIYASAADVTSNQIIIDLPRPDRIAVSGREILVRSGAGDVELPNLYFDPEKWSRAYQTNKHCGFVFCAKRDHIPAVNLAAKIVFAEELKFVMSEAADRLTKTTSLHEGFIFAKSLECELTDLDTCNRLENRETRFAVILADDLAVPDNWTKDGRDVRQELAKQLRETRARGYTASQHKTIVELIDGLASFYDVAYEGGVLKTVKVGEEARLQNAVRDHLRSRGFKVDEAMRVSGGQNDLLFQRQLTIENKIYNGMTDNPLGVGPNYAWQARRYAIPTSTEVIATVVGYKPITELGHYQGRDSIDIRLIGDDRTVEIRIAVPIDYTNPSDPDAPPRKTTKKSK